MNELDKQFYQKTDMLLEFTENVHEYFKKGNFDQRRRILEIISDGITYKDGECPYSCDMTNINQTTTNIYL